MIKILIFRTDRIGDLIMTCSAIISLKKYFNQSEITFQNVTDFIKKYFFLILSITTSEGIRFTEPLGLSTS